MFCFSWLHNWLGEVSYDAVLCILWGFIYMLIFTLEKPLDTAETSSLQREGSSKTATGCFDSRAGQVQHGALQSVLTSPLSQQAARMGHLRPSVLEDICKQASGESSQEAAPLKLRKVKTLWRWRRAGNTHWEDQPPYKVQGSHPSTACLDTFTARWEMDCKTPFIPCIHHLPAHRAIGSGSAAGTQMNEPLSPHIPQFAIPHVLGFPICDICATCCMR